MQAANPTEEKHSGNGRPHGDLVDPLNKPTARLWVCSGQVEGLGQLSATGDAQFVVALLEMAFDGAD